MDKNDTCTVLIHDGGGGGGDGRRSDDDDDEEDGCADGQLIYILNLILIGTARLNVLLPTATILAFAIFAPLLSNDGRCDGLHRALTSLFLAACAASCVFFTFTDSFRSPSGRLYYGVATPRGIWPFNARRRGKAGAPPDAAAYRLSWPDLFHAALSLAAFMAFAGLHRDVTECYGVRLPRKVTNAAPLAVGFAVSVAFVVFPSRRRGIGYPFLLQKDAAFFK
ncbi:protein DMP2-like [Zingiber officinale]|uniref:Uncharacterized protein n=1 Tax=Zingiber officinale TaxID=94328 RepID=A0A8J5HSA5_ZINOF|nr:protein DMP2-like [Zingiber officinale]KAG6530183.1 hypothetical protein ZIOFF_012405 [Zingiber officinale]